MKHAYLICRILLAAAIVAAAGSARSEILDRVEILRVGNEAEITIRLTTPVRYLGHSPKDSGNLLSVDLELVGIGAGTSDLERLVQSVRQSPPADKVPPFTVTYPAANGTMAIEFAQPTRFSVLPGQDGRSLRIFVPLLPGPGDRVPMPPQPSAAASAPTEVVQAIDVINVQRRGNQAEINIQFAAPIEYARHTPPDAGNLLRIYAGSGKSNWQLPETGAQVLTAPETDLIPRITVTYPDIENALAIAFDRATRYTVRQGGNNRSISVVVPILPNARDWSVQIKGATVAATAPPSSPQIVPGAFGQSAQPTGTTANVGTASAPAAAAMADASTPAASSVPRPAFVAMPKDELESRAKEAMEAARKAIAARSSETAVARLNQILSLPPNSQTEAASALMGEAREIGGEYSRAAAEYESYLKTFPNGQFTSQVKERLAAISKQRGGEAIPSVGLKPATGPATWVVGGGVSQYFYYGNANMDTQTPPAPAPGQNQINTTSFYGIDQRSLISTLDYSARRRDDVTDTRIVVRAVDNHSYLQDQGSYDRLYTGYVEQTNKDVGYYYRVGRQLGTGGGVTGRFDGLSAGYNLNPTLRLNGVIGAVADFWDPFNRNIYGVSLEFVAQPGRAGITPYYMRQTLQGVVDREVVGTDFRYFDEKITLFSTVDYDINFKTVNVGLVQANLRTDSGTTYYANVDIRRAPPLGVATAIPGQIPQGPPFPPPLNWQTLFNTSLANLGLDQLRNQAATLTSTSSLYTFGFIRPISQRWQLGLDYRQANLTGTGASGVLQALPGTGTTHIYSGQALGSSLLRPNDSFTVNASAVNAEQFTGQNYTLAYMVPVNEWRFDALLGYYYQIDNLSQRQTRVTPTARVVYRIKKQLSLELDAGSEIFDEWGTLQQHYRRYFMYGGYRWDFN